MGRLQEIVARINGLKFAVTMFVGPSSILLFGYHESCSFQHRRGNRPRHRL